MYFLNRAVEPYVLCQLYWPVSSLGGLHCHSPIMQFSEFRMNWNKVRNIIVICLVMKPGWRVCNYSTRVKTQRNPPVQRQLWCNVRNIQWHCVSWSSTFNSSLHPFSQHTGCKVVQYFIPFILFVLFSGFRFASWSLTNLILSCLWIKKIVDWNSTLLLALFPFVRVRPPVLPFTQTSRQLLHQCDVRVRCESVNVHW